MTVTRVLAGLALPAEATEADGFLFWRIEARTRMSGPDYFTRFPIGGPETDA
jgi:hypothetical protein